MEIDTAPLLQLLVAVFQAMNEFFFLFSKKTHPIKNFGLLLTSPFFGFEIFFAKKSSSDNGRFFLVGEEVGDINYRL